LARRGERIGRRRAAGESWVRNLIGLVWLPALILCGPGVARAAGAAAEVTYVITNGGVDVKGAGEAHFYAHGHHNGPTIDWARSGGAARMPAGSYDVHITFMDGAAAKDVWLDNQTFSGKVQRRVEIALPVAQATYVITNGGVDTQGKGEAHYYPPGRHDGPTIDWARSGGAVRLPAGSYNVHVTFMDGAAVKDAWIDDQRFSGAVRKTVDIGLGVADVSLLITNGGVDAKDKGEAHYHRHGQHDGPTIDWARSGGEVRIPSGAYDVDVTFREGMADKRIWLDNQSFSGRVRRTVEMNLPLAEPVVAVTQNGADVGGKATVDYFDPSGLHNLGAVMSRQTAVLAQGAYTIRATLAGGEGWLHKVALAGKPHLVIALQARKTQTLRLGGPPPKACTLEVYGVNFDFNKAVLRGDSTPMLRQILALFTSMPAFSAEVSGHTDNIGAPAYNLKLSDARAAAVKTWLVQQGVAPARIASRGYGDTRPLAPNTTDENRFKNRRVELRRANCV
jgi:outer membrane protein OmpA-like peptidoglycan-associated protein